MTNGWTDSAAITYVPFRQPQGSAKVLEGTVAFDLRHPNSICQRDNWSPVPYNRDSGIIKYYISNMKTFRQSSIQNHLAQFKFP